MLALLSVAAVAAEEEAAPRRKPAGREYSDRVQMHDVTVSATPVVPEEPRVTAPESLGSDSAFMPGLFVTTEMLLTLPPPAPSSSRRAKRDQNWLLPSALNVKTESDKALEEERRESGWGWLADDVSERRKTGDEEAAPDEAAAQDDDFRDGGRVPGATGMMMDPPEDRRLAASVYEEVGVRDAQELARVDGRADPRALREDDGGLLRTRVSALENPEDRDLEVSERDPADAWKGRDRSERSLMPRTEALFAPAVERERVAVRSQSSRAEPPAPGSLLVPGEAAMAKPAASVYEWGGAQPRAAAPSGSALPGITPASSLGKAGSLFGATPIAPPSFGGSPMPSYATPGFQAGKPADMLRPWGSTLPTASTPWQQPATGSK